MRVKNKVHIGGGKRSRHELREGEAPVVVSGRLPRVSRLMALAIKFDAMIASGEVTDMAELARLGHVTRARMTQVMNLLNLAPDIQETLLFLPRVESGRDPVFERQLRAITAEPHWGKQRAMSKWRESVANGNYSHSG